MKDSDKILCSILLEVLEAQGVRDIVCSPGSRNTPLLLGAASRESFRKHFSVDERSGAFKALGIAMVSRHPVVLICTSGTALLNYAPAVAEAFYQGIPLIVISADRPIQWIDQDDSQTLRQDNVLDNFVKKSYTIPASGESEREIQWYANRISNDAMLTATGGKPGPVHINIAIGEPLGNLVEREKSDQRLIKIIRGDSIGNKGIVKGLAQEVSRSKVLLVAGFMLPDSGLQKALATFSSFKNVAVMSETISNLHLSPEAYSIDSTLTALSDDTLEELAPELVITVGGALVSRKLKEYLRKNSNRSRHWSIGYQHTSVDPFMSLSLRIEADPVRFFRNLNSALTKAEIEAPASRYQKIWQHTKLQALALKANFIAQSPWSELIAFDTILKALPGDRNLFLSNGTAIRYAQIIDYKLPHASYCNRGVSGIDGSLSTAIGGALAYKGATVLISGDLSMSYDIGALSQDTGDRNFKIIVIDNGGGGIFRFIPSTSELECREEYFCMPPRLPLRQLADGYGYGYHEAEDKQSLEALLPGFFMESGRAILRVICDGELSARILREYMNCRSDIIRTKRK